MIWREALYLIVAGTIFTLATAENVNCTQNLNCTSCISGDFLGKCAWCSKSGLCLTYDPVYDIKTLKGCDSSFYATNCVVSHMLVLVGAGIGGSILLLVIAAITIWCCCCKGKKARKKKARKEEAEYQKQRDDIKTKHEAGRSERQEKHDAIRMKYGLKKSNAYERME